jgi:hypothetical protein
MAKPKTKKAPPRAGVLPINSNLRDDLVIEVKVLAAERRQTLRVVLEEALTQWVAGQVSK